MKYGTLIQQVTKDGLHLHGYYQPGGTKTALLHIHGFEGNFYENWFVHVIAEEARKADIPFLTANTRGNGKITDFNTVDKKIVTIGAHFEKIEEAYIDIDAWIGFLTDQGYNDIILQGHSLGTVKVVRYLFEGKLIDKVKKLILLAPFDGKGLIDKYVGGDIDELVKRAEEKIKDGKGDEMTTEEFETVEMSFNTYVGWYQRNDFGRMFEFCNPKYDFPLLNKISIPVKVIVGSNDEYFHQSNPDHPEVAVTMLKNNLNTCETVLIKGANHQYTGHQEELAREIIRFI